MTDVLLLGAGKIGRMIATLLTRSSDYRLRIGDVSQAALTRIEQQVDAETVIINADDAGSLSSAMEGAHAVISALSYRQNPAVAQAALESGASYFDLTEDVATTRVVRELAQKAQSGQVFVPQCGLAPGFISIAANDLAGWFDEPQSIQMRVGALPEFPTHALKYDLTWSTDGLINEYCNPCEAILEGKQIELLPLEGLEEFSLDGVSYEAFNTSGGLGTLCDKFAADGLRELTYKTIRYPGHRNLMKFLLEDLRLRERRAMLREILEFAVPITYQDVVIVFCNVTGMRKGSHVKKSMAIKLYPTVIEGEVWSAIQVTTASALCALVDLWRSGNTPTTGFVRQEDIHLGEFLANRFGQVYAAADSTRTSVHPT
jgi:saccharopine dehydrogenase-like NADP-dependent oxidoreductase